MVGEACPNCKQMETRELARQERCKDLDAALMALREDKIKAEQLVESYLLEVEGTRRDHAELKRQHAELRERYDTRQAVIADLSRQVAEANATLEQVRATLDAARQAARRQAKAAEAEAERMRRPWWQFWA